MDLRNTDGRLYAQFIPSRPEAIESMLRLAAVTPNDIVYDIGCGSGDVLYRACQLGVRTTGVEHDPFLVARAKEKLRGMNGLVVRGSILEDRFWAHKGYGYSYVVQNASVVTVYLGGGLNDALRPLLEQELRPGTRVVSNFFPVRSWNPIEADRKNSVFLYLL